MLRHPRFLASLFALCACQGQLRAPAPPSAPRTVSIDATATLHLPPDRAAVTLTFRSSQERHLAAAHVAVEEARANFLRRAASFEARLESGTIQYSTHRPHAQAQDEFIAEQTVVVHTADFDDIPGIVRLGNSSLGRVHVRYYVHDMAQHRSRLRDMATDAARRKAEELADGFGASLGEVLTIREGNATVSSYGVGNENVFARVEAASSETPPPGAVPLRVTLHVSYALR